MSLRNYVITKIRFAILDYVRTSCVGGYRVSRALRDMEGAVTDLRNSGDDASAEAIARKLDMPLDEYQRLRSEVYNAQVVSLDQKIGSYDNKPRRSDTLRDTSCPSADKIIESVTIRKIVQKSLPLPEERKVIELLFEEGLSQRQACARMNRSEAWVSHVKTNALNRIRSGMERYEYAAA